MDRDRDMGSNGNKGGKAGKAGKTGRFPLLSLGWMAVALMISFPNARTGDTPRAGDTRDTLNAPVAADSAAPRSATVERMRLELDTLGQRIEALKSRLAKAGAKAGDKAKKETRDEVAALERAKDKLAERIDSLGEASSGAWLRMKARAKSGMDSLKADVDRLRDKLRD